MSTTDIGPASPGGPNDRGGHRAPDGEPVMSPSEQRSALVRLAAIVIAGILASALLGVAKTVAVVVAIIVMIMLHEFGHFITAKRAGMKVTEFFVGFGPRLWSVRKGETEYGVKAIPVGGYVKIIGMTNLDEVPPEDEPRTYRQQPFWRRLSVAVAGSTMHFIIAFILLFVLVSFVGIQRFDKPTLQVGEITRIDGGPSPAQEAGFKPGDTIVSLDGMQITHWEDLPPYIRAHPGQQLTFVVKRGGQDITLHATPVDLRQIHVKSGGAPDISGDQPYGFIGIGPSAPVERAGIITGIGRAGRLFGTYAKGTVGALVNLVSLHGVTAYSHQLTGPTPAKTDPNQPRFLSPVGFVRVASQAADTGFRDVLALLVLMNIFVGIFNLVPLLPLDGGHVAIAAYEKIRSRKGRLYHADVAKLMPLTYGVFLVLVFIGLSSLYLDIVHPVGNPFQ
jgi:membrane-associated protease RseP (regulator of RpoE activity)